jgi:hypothetical protein
VEDRRSAGCHRSQAGVHTQDVVRELFDETPRSTPAVAPDRPVADDNPGLEQLASDALGAPETVLARTSF